MFRSLMHKQIKILLRSPHEILLLLVMPIVLIVILSIALSSMWGGDGNTEITKVKVAIVEHDQKEQVLQSFMEKVKTEFPLIEDVEQPLSKMLPSTILYNLLTEDPEMKKFVHVTTLESNELKKAREGEDYDAIIEIPNGFSFDYLSSIFLNTETPTFKVFLNEGNQFTSTILQNILNTFQYQTSLFTKLTQKGLLKEEAIIPTFDISSEIKTIDSKEPITSSIYYTFSMTVMFILYIAGTLANHAFLEKQHHIFDRILLARIHPITYLMSIVGSTIILAMVQVLLLFFISYLIFDLPFENWTIYLFITFMLSLVVGGIAALLSSLNFRGNSAAASNIFSNAFVAILALLGGSYFNISGLSPLIANVGLWTPNGAALQAYLIAVQGGTISEIQPMLTILAILAVVMIILAFVLFPKRGGIA